MFSVIFEVQPNPEQWDAYLARAKMLRPELERMDGFVDNIRYKSLSREGWILSLSNWRDEKAVVRWRTKMQHHAVQEEGRSHILSDYHLRVGQLTHDTRVPMGYVIEEQRLDVTDVGEGKAITLVNGRRPANWTATNQATETAKYLGLDPAMSGVADWDVFDAVLTPGDLILLVSWRTKDDSEAFALQKGPPADGRLRNVRVVRDYGMFDRREAPQYYPGVDRRP